MGGTISRDFSLNAAAAIRCNNKKIKPTLSTLPEEKPNSRIICGREYHAIENSAYMLPKDDKEIDRLHDQHFITKEILGFNIMKEALKILDFEKETLCVLDICCGPATWLCEESLEYPNCRFTGIDMCNSCPQVIRPVNLNFIEANILKGLPYPDKSFDFIQMRFVELAFKLDEWQFVISEIKRILKDGGCFQWIDVDMRVNVTNGDTIIKTYTEAFESFCTKYNLDPSVGPKLDYLLTNEKMKIIQTEYREMPLGWGGPVGHAYLQTFQGALEGLAPWLKNSFNTENDQEYDFIINNTKRAFIQSKAFMNFSS
ncbi:hypothetical protein G6F43_004713 [Rhizopus delemar]|nr:hypothetical protein G6F43_004713 [Rhizopus delemar]